MKRVLTILAAMALALAALASCDNGTTPEGEPKVYGEAGGIKIYKDASVTDEQANAAAATIIDVYNGEGFLQADRDNLVGKITKIYLVTDKKWHYEGTVFECRHDLAQYINAQLVDIAHGTVQSGEGLEN